MNTLFKIFTATAFIVCVSFNASAATENQSNALISIVKHSVNKTVTQANESIELGLQKSILTNIHNISIGNEDTPVGKVKIIDLVSNTQIELKEESKTDKSKKAE